MTHPGPSEINADQRTFWNEGPGQTWARLQDLLDVQHAEAAQLLLAHAAIGTGEAVLDIGCGGGATTLAAAEAVGPEGRVLGLDISTPILKLARSRAAASGATNVDFELGDAQIRAGGGDFDLAMSRFGVMFFDDPAAAFANIRAHLRPGGRIAWICWAGPQHNFLFRVSAQSAAEVFGTAPTPDPTAPGPMAFQDIDRVTSLLHTAGFEDARGVLISGTLGVPRDMARTLVSDIGPVASRIRTEGGSDAQREAATDRVLARFAEFETDGVYALPCAYVVYTARTP
ncbi:class I SAM-dependent methyltransferase [Roseisalinus antarcticus]|uniref:Demethylmenaquinone methyltransferase n=1 Tax=Roseisalinus antarcticus TaxID=254357 RepID=A0A1Y5RJQ0_9RHOB|nr:class I SAM-dependent methyltransferase [Roseisalinus antarcticus]SLN16441.1 Demethylmenaquinone methyltransferase [Roseisalinus antarcticus]